MEQKEFERIASLETQLEGLQKSLERIETKLDAYNANFIPRKEADIRFQNIEGDVEELKANRKSNAALVVSIAAIAVSFIFNLLNYVN